MSHYQTKELNKLAKVISETTCPTFECCAGVIQESEVASVPLKGDCQTLNAHRHWILLEQVFHVFPGVYAPSYGLVRQSMWLRNLICNLPHSGETLAEPFLAEGTLT
jgi:hypothetical protein